MLVVLLILCGPAVLTAAPPGSAADRNHLRVPEGRDRTDEAAAREWLAEHNRLHGQVLHKQERASWQYDTNLTDFNQNLMLLVRKEVAEFEKDAYRGARAFNWKPFSSSVRRLLSKVSDIGTSILNPADNEKLNDLGAKLTRVYSVAKVCNKPGQKNATCHPLNPDLDDIVSKSRDWELLLWAWQGWRNASGRPMSELYTQYVTLQNEAARLNGFSDAGAYWRWSYETEAFREVCADLWGQLKPFYQHLHAFARRRLRQTYPDRPFPRSGHIPAHILGNMWSQQWNSLGDILRPVPEAHGVDVTDAMLRQGYDVTRVVRLAEEFFTSVGLSAMPPTFWSRSLFTRPPDREVVCHASAWDFFDQRDFRIKQCTQVNMDWLFTTHHEMGHVEYFLEYKDQPTVFRDGANPGFHEAIGDIMELSVSTPEHLQNIGLLSNYDDNQGAGLNFLLDMALRKVAFLPFGYLVDQWRWDVFSGKTTPQNYNRDWWKLRCSIQGVAPPVPRSEEDFDPGAKFHISDNTPYIRYFISHILQFQIHKALCEAAHHTGPLHRCDIYRSREAGARLSNALRLGSSVPWPEVLRNLTGSSAISVKPLLEYFGPLRQWLQQQNEGHDVAWQPECPDGSVTSSRGHWGYTGNCVLIISTCILVLCSSLLKR